MNIKLRSEIILESGSPRGFLHNLAIGYAYVSVVTIIIMTYFINGIRAFNFHFALNIITVLLLTWFIQQSFSIKISRWNLKSFRIGLFFLLNSTLFTIAGEVKILHQSQGDTLASLIYAPAICLIIYSFRKFINVVNVEYKNVFEVSLTDCLTGLPNRRFLNHKLNSVEEDECVICIFDIDDFKSINDTYGHDAGDLVLKKMGSILKEFADHNTFIARSGGEEFCIIITNSQPDNNIIIKIKNSISLTSFGGISATISMGVAEKKRKNTSSQGMCAADNALYQSKTNGKNMITYSKSLG